VRLKVPSIVTHLTDNPIRAFALVCVAATSGFFAYLAIELINILKSPEWCGKALQAERITPGGTFVGLTSCMDLLKMQVAALAQTLLIVIGTFALCLGVLVVIVIAGARLAGKILGQDIDVSRQDPPPASAAQAASEVADAADQAAAEIIEETRNG
jgi:hypothetical protein